MTDISLSDGTRLTPPAELRYAVQPVLQADKVCLTPGHPGGGCTLTAPVRPYPHLVKGRWRYNFCCDYLGARARSDFPTAVAVACSDFPLLTERRSWLVLSTLTLADYLLYI